MKFREKTTIQSADVDMRGVLRPTALLAKLEDVGGHQMIAFPPSNDDLRERGLAFITSRMVIQIRKELRENMEVDMETWATDSRGLSFNRCYRMLHDGEVAADVYSSWALLNFEEHTLVRVHDFGEVGGEQYPPLTLDIPLRVRMPAAEEYTEVAKRKIYYSDVDLNGHLNNTKYLNMLCDFVPGIENKSLRGINISYVTEAPLGEELTVLCKADGDTYYFKTVRSDGKINCEAVLYF